MSNTKRIAEQIARRFTMGGDYGTALTDAIDAALRQREQEVRAEGWLPIESAPKDGSRVWLFGTALTFDGYERPNAMIIGMWISDKWRVVASGQPREMEIKAEHWQSLPTPPTIRRDDTPKEGEQSK